MNPDELADRLAQLEELSAQSPVAARDATLDMLRAELETMVAELRKPLQGESAEDEAACRGALENIQGFVTTIAMSAKKSTDEDQDPAAVGVYAILSKIGEGGMGKVFKARHTKLDKIVALKLLPAALIKDQSAAQRFEREMRAVGRLEHPNIVRATDAGEIDGQHFLAMEYVTGIDLAQLVHKSGPLAIADACEIIRQAATGLAEAHEHGMVHRDIKPSNLMLATLGRKQQPVVKVLDLGLALLSEAQEAGDGLTQTNQAIGTLDYMAPEQINDSHQVDSRADIYALGATLYAILTGVTVFHGERYQKFVHKAKALLAIPAPPVQALRSDIPNGLAAIIHRLLEKDPSERFQSSEDLVQALAAFCEGANLSQLLRSAGFEATTEPSSVTKMSVAPASAVAPPRKPSKSKSAFGISRLLIGAACVASLAAALAGTILLLQTPRGTLRVEINDPSIDVRVQGSNIVLNQEKDAVTIGAGEKSLLVTSGNFKFETDKFELKKGDVTTIKVELLAGELRVAKADGTPLGSQKAAADVVLSTPQKPLPPTAAASIENPFALVRKGETIRKFQRFAALQEELAAGDEIVVSGNGPYSLPRIELTDQPLTISSAPGYRPRFYPSGSVRSELSLVVPWISVSNAPLRLTGCDFISDVAHLGVIAAGGDCEIEGCRLAKADGRNDYLLKATGKRVRITNSMLFTGFSHVSFLLGPDVELTFDNNLYFNRAYIFFSPAAPGGQKLTLTNNTFYGASHVIGTHGDFVRPIKVESTRNLISDPDAVGWMIGVTNASFERIKEIVDWHGLDNLRLHPGPTSFIRGENSAPDMTQQEDWERLWAGKDKGHRELAARPFQFDLAWEQQAYDKQLTVIRNTIATVMPEGMQNVGPQWAEVGPGAGYLKALAAAGKAVPEDQLRPEMPEGGPIVLLRAEKIVDAYRDFAAAVEAAADRDVLELRTDKTLPSLSRAENAKPKNLTLRAAPGYMAGLTHLTLASGDLWEIEGIRFEGQINPHPGHVPAGRIARLANCSFPLVLDPRSPLATVLKVDQAKPLEITNCIIPTRVWLYKAAKESKVSIKNSILGTMLQYVEESPGKHHLELERCAVWHRSFVVSAAPQNELSLAANGCWFETNSLWYSSGQTSWQGDHNVFRNRPSAWCTPTADGKNADLTRLNLWQKQWSSDEHSVQLDPIVFEPAQWKLRPGVPGQGEGPNGKDLGVDVERLLPSTQPSP